ncbi:MAG: NAD(+) synthase [Polyangia bacterium]
MRLVRIALANVDTIVGAVASNLDKALSLVPAAIDDGATVLVFPEQLLSGYPPEDLVQWRGFVHAQWKALAEMARATADRPIAIVAGVTVQRGNGLYNCAALLHRGRICGLVPKEKLPTYNVFYEGRTMNRGIAGLYDELEGVPFGDLVFQLDFGTVALEICEDLWSPDGPMRRRCYAGAELVLNLSASPFRVGIVDTRREMIATRAADNQCVVAYTNAVGANDGLIFDGGGFIAQNGRVVHEARRFESGITAATVDLDRTARLRAENTTWRNDQEAARGESDKVRRIRVEGDTDRRGLTYPVPAHASFFLPSPPEPEPTAREAFCEELLDALAMGIGSYYEKVGVFETIGVALSGGRDSLLVMLLCRRWIDRRFPDEAEAKARKMLRAFFMPSRYSSPETRAAAIETANEVGAALEIVDIDETVAVELLAIEKMLQPGETLTRAAKQNIQARIRGQRMWTWSNVAAGLFLQTSNMSEKAVGYSTIGGDSEGALAVIANLPKTVVNYLLDYLLEKTKSEAIRLTLLKPASAELDESQEDERDLMPFPVLDACFALYAGEKMTPGEVAEVLAVMFPDHDAAQLCAWAGRFQRLFNASIYKWVQAPVSLHVGNLDLERERALQLPVVQKAEW